MTNQEKFLEDWFGHEVDMLPFANRAVAECPYRHDFTAMELCELMAKGGYINVATRARVEGRNLWWLTSYVTNAIRKITYWADQIAALSDPDVIRLMPYLSLSSTTNSPICAAAEALDGRWLSSDELKPFPLDGCDCNHCGCYYRRLSRRRAQRDYPERPV